MHWAPVQAKNVGEFVWLNSERQVHRLESSGWSVFGCCAALCPSQTLPSQEEYADHSKYFFSTNTNQDKVDLYLGTLLKPASRWNAAASRNKQWLVVGHTEAGTPRVHLVLPNSNDTTVECLRWTKNGWSISGILLEIIN